MTSYTPGVREFERDYLLTPGCVVALGDDSAQDRTWRVYTEGEK